MHVVVALRVAGFLPTWMEVAMEVVMEVAQSRKNVVQAAAW